MSPLREDEMPVRPSLPPPVDMSTLPGISPPPPVPPAVLEALQIPPIKPYSSEEETGDGDA